jgi:hypothetical protein
VKRVKANTWLNTTVTEEERKKLSEQLMAGVYVAIVLKALGELKP